MIFAEAVTFSGGEMFILMVIFLSAVAVAAALGAALMFLGVFAGANLRHPRAEVLIPRVMAVALLTAGWAVTLFGTQNIFAVPVPFLVALLLGAGRSTMVIRPRKEKRSRGLADPVSAPDEK